MKKHSSKEQDQAILMEKLKKSIIFTAVIVISVITVVLASFKIFTSYNFSEKDLKVFISAFVKENFNKAVKFDDIYVSLAGNIIITNLNVSSSSDFNDNVSLIKCETGKLYLDFAGILGGKIIVKGVFFDGSEITILKKYTKSYIDNLREIFSLCRPLNTIKNISADDFSVSIDSHHLYYKDAFKDSMLFIDFTDMTASLKLKKNILLYGLKGSISPNKSPGASKGKISLEGKLLLNAGNDYMSSSSSVSISDFDLSYLNHHINEYLSPAASVSGAMSCSITLNGRKNDLSIVSGVEISHLFAACNNCDSETYNVISNEGAKVELVLDILNDAEILKIRKAGFSDGNIKILAGGIYKFGEMEKYFDIFFKTNNINLTDVAGSITPFRNMAYGGHLSSEGRIWYDLQNNVPRNTLLNASLEKFWLKTASHGKPDTSLVSNLDLKLALNDYVLNIDFSGMRDHSDLAVSSESHIMTWSPLCSETSMKINSRHLEFGRVFSLITSHVDYLYGEAFEDKKLGYEEMFFNKMPAGIIVNGNDVRASVKIDRILLKKNAGLQNMSFDLGLKKGVLDMKGFSLTGYDGIYTCDLKGYFNQDYPVIHLKSGVRNLNVKKLSIDSGMKGDISGELSADLEYDMSAYRLAHLVENSKALLSLTISKGSLQNTAFQDEAGRFLRNNGYDNINIDSITFEKASLDFSQSADFFFVKSLSLFGDSMSFNSSGKYSYQDGLNIPLNVSVRSRTDKSKDPSKTDIPLKFGGRLLSPFVSISKGKDENKLVLFNVN
jgi:hypothetical protein